MDTRPGEGLSSPEKMLKIIDLYADERSVWTVEAIAARLGLSISTTYRYVKILSRSGLLAAIGGGTFALGVKIIQLDRSIRRSDPLIAASRAAMRVLARELQTTLVLATLHGDHVICIHEETDLPERSEDLRGLTVPVYRGATAKMIMSHLPVQRQNRILLQHHAEMAAGARVSIESFRKNLRRIRAAGYCLAPGEVDPGLTAMAVPIFNADRKIEGSLAAILRSEHADRALSLLEPLRRVAEAIGESIAMREPDDRG